MDPRPQPVPSVDGHDVERVVCRDFSAEHFASVMDLLNTYNTEQSNALGRFRVQLAALKIANGNLEDLRRAMDLAQSDFRDVIVPAEYPSCWEMGFSKYGALSAAQKDEVHDQDWRQYEQWLKK